ncbi:nicotinate-nucleotide--dimethylbenzimidazole phosphoribosyltransferase [Hydrotalea sp.]|uniref:nicotinate-nucleotide--dimethylbenzimidazole phosphoribosyltransferase n=1 Tax=Hydrotalea sp. TaxID=2881279 RepID=UPI003D0DD37E
MELFDVLNKRRDTRHFTNDVVPDMVLKKALRAAHMAPSVGLSEATKYYLILEQHIKNAIHELFQSENQKVEAELLHNTALLQQYKKLKLEAIKESPVGLIITTDYSVLEKFTIGISGTADTLQWSSVCALQNLWLSLTENGFSLGWVSILNFTAFKNLLNIPAHEYPLGYFCIGKPATDYGQQPMLQKDGWKSKSKNLEVKEIKQLYPTAGNSANFQFSKITGTYNTVLKEALIKKINGKTKPAGALGMLESIAVKVGCIQETTAPIIKNPNMIIFAADHGIAKTGLVNPYPQVVTQQMVRNFLQGGAAINVFCRQNSLKLTIVDAGINCIWKNEDLEYPNFTVSKINMGTKNYLEVPAMTKGELATCLQKGREYILQLKQQQCNTIALGEMGIGNSSSAALIMHGLLNIPLAACVGRGTGTNNDQYQKKLKVLEKVAHQYHLHNNNIDPLQLLQLIGGFEIAMLTGAYLQAAAEKMVTIADGFITTAALLVAKKLQPNVTDYCIASHLSNEKGHQQMLAHLQLQPLLQLDLRLGEGTGAALALPLIQSAIAMLNEMNDTDSFQINGPSN